MTSSGVVLELVDDDDDKENSCVKCEGSVFDKTGPKKHKEKENQEFDLNTNQLLLLQLKMVDFVSITEIISFNSKQFIWV